MRKFICSLFISLILAASGNSSVENNADNSTVQDESMQMVNAIHKAHYLELFQSNGVVQFDLSLVFGGKQLFDGKITMMTDGSRILMEDTNGI